MWTTTLMTTLALATGAAGPQATEVDPEKPPMARAVHVDGPVTVDGTLDDPAWSKAPAASGLVQVEPDEGAPATEPTEIRFLHDGENLYVGARLHASHPPRTRLGRRDAALQDSDWFAVMLDANGDGMTAYRFRVNPSGVRGDELLARDGGTDDSWEPVWEAAASVDEEGWTATMRIPLSQIRFDEETGVPWGLQVERTLRRNDETVVFSFTPRREAAGIPRYGRLEGMDETDPGRHLEAMPYVTAQAQRSAPGPEDARASSSQGDFGVDLRYRLSSAFTLDGAVNPDFGQVEADPAQISLNAFERRFPENRPFFVEGADLFRFNRGMVTPDLFYSRRVGAAPQGHLPAGAVTEQGLDAVPILGAGKITGRTSDGWSLGFLGAHTDRESAPFTDADGNRGSALVEPRTTYLAGRARRELREGGTTVGAMGTAVRRGDTSPEELRHLNDAGYAGGADVRHEFRDRRWQVRGAFQASRVEGRPEAIATLQRASLRYFQRPDAQHLDMDPEQSSLSGWAGHASIRRQAGEHWRGGVQVGAVSPEHEVNDLGFQNDADRVSAMANLDYRQDEPGSRFHRWRVFGQGGTQANFGGDLLLAGVMAGFDGTLQNRWGFRVQANRMPSTLDDRATRGGPLIRTPGQTGVLARVRSDTRRSLALQATANYRRADDGGDGAMVRGRVTFRPTSHWSVTLSPRFIRNTSPLQYLGAVDDPAASETFGTRYLFGEVDQRVLELGVGLDLALRPGLTLEFHGQGYVTGGRFDKPGQLRRPRSRTIDRFGKDVGEVEETEEGLRVDPAPGADDGGEPFVLPDRDFTFRSFRGSAVLRWEWHRGSTLYLVWQQDRSARLNEADFRLGRGLTQVTDTPGRDTFQLKVSYWVNPF